LVLRYSSIIFFRSKAKKNKTSYNTEIRISKITDELANDVFQTMAFAETQDLSTSQNKILLNNLRHHLFKNKKHF
jgi:hypothetical protein